MVVSIDGEESRSRRDIRGELGVSVESNPRFGHFVFATMEKYFGGRRFLLGSFSRIDSST